MSSKVRYKVHITYNDKYDMEQKGDLAKLRDAMSTFADINVTTNEDIIALNIDHLNDEEKIESIKKNIIKNATTTIVLLGKCTTSMKHIDWEIASSMVEDNKLGVIVIDLLNRRNIVPSSKLRELHTPGSTSSNWDKEWKSTFRKDFDYLPFRIIENIMVEQKDSDFKYDSTIPVLTLSKIMENPIILKQAIKYIDSKLDNIVYETAIPLKQEDENCTPSSYVPSLGMH